MSEAQMKILCSVSLTNINPSSLCCFLRERPREDIMEPICLVVESRQTGEVDVVDIPEV
jgi:hypothetical protein